MEDVNLEIIKRMKLELGREEMCWSTFCGSHSDKEPLLQCTGCGVARYCREGCQETDGQRHRDFCQGVQRWKRSFIIPDMDMESVAISNMLRPTDHTSIIPKEQTYSSLVENTSPGLKEHNFPSFEEHASPNFGEHILSLMEQTSSSFQQASSSFQQASLNFSKYTPRNLMKHTSSTLGAHSSISLKKYTSPCFKELKSPNLKNTYNNIEENTSQSFENVSAILEEHIFNILEKHVSLNLKEHNSPNLEKLPSPNHEKHTFTNLQEQASPSLEELASRNFMEHTSPSLEKDASPIINKSTCNYGINDCNDSVDKSERNDPFKMEQDLNINRQTFQESKINIESVICILCKFMFPGGSRIEDFSEVFFTHLKDDHGIIHNHLHLLESSMVRAISTVNSTVTSTQPSTWRCELPKSEERRKRIRGC